MNNDTGGDRPMPGTRMRRLFDENLSMIETMTRIEIRRLGRMPRGTHLGQDDGNPVTDLLPDRYLDRYDREFLYRMLGAAIRLRPASPTRPRTMRPTASSRRSSSAGPSGSSPTTTTRRAADSRHGSRTGSATST